ncbi:MAG: hypothetical protein ACLQD8_05970 [Thermoplasmata archaeon]
MPTTPEGPPFPYAFAVIAFGASIVIGVLIAIFGIRGQLGWGIP